MTHRKNRDLEEIIAAHRDTIEAKNALIGDLRRDLGEASQELRTANARDEAAERDAKQAWEEVSRVQQVGLRAESESAALRAEVRRLKVENHHLLQTKRWHEINAETRASLAAANALLGELRELHATVPRHCGLLEMVCFYNCVGERLAAQPATARSEPYPLGHGARHFPELYAQPTRTDAEQCVLDAMANADIRPEQPGYDGPVMTLDDEYAVCRAEIARRGLK